MRALGQLHSPAQAANKRSREPRRAASLLLAALILAYTFSFIDRSVLTLMVRPIRASLKISDVQLSLLHGFAFAIFYTFMGIPIGRLVDRRRRVGIVIAGAALWSVATALCGLATSFAAMFAARIAVGIGESTLSPAAYSMLADTYEGKRLVRALSIYQSAIYVGPAIATFFGGMLLASLPVLATPIGLFQPWQQVFLIVGLPGLLIAASFAFIPEPERRGTGASGSPPKLGDVLRYLAVRRHAYGLLILGLCLQGLMWNGATAWIPTHLMRAYGWTTGDVAWRYGPMIALCGVTGILFGGWLTGRMRDQGLQDSNVRIGVVAALAACPFAIAAPLVASGALSLVLLGCFLFAGAMPYGGAAASFQEITPNRMRGQVSAMYLFGLNLAGIGFGPTMVALTSQHLFRTDAGISPAISIVCGAAALLSALVLAIARAPYRRAMALNEPNGRIDHD